MSTPARLIAVLVCALNWGWQAPAADAAAKQAPVKAAEPVEPPGETELRACVTKSLGFIEREGEEWMAAKNCNGCHHMPEMLWSHREARRRGFAVDAQKYEEWLAWAMERATDKRPGLEEAALMIMAVPERATRELTALIAAEQKPDGFWNAAGQFSGMQKRGAEDAQANALRLHLIALATPQPAVPEAAGVQAKAAPALQKKDRPTTMESLVFRTLHARRFGQTADAEALVKDIVKRQRGDGGWSYILGENMSDILATGQVLYVLQESASDRAVADAVARAQHWLLKTQSADGSWPVDITHISQNDRSGPDKAKSFKDATGIYTYWGCAWATLGLLQGLPVKPSLQ